MGVWVQLRQAKYITQQGRRVPFQAGDWVEIGRATALEWIADGSAVARDTALTRVQAPKGGAGIMLFGAKKNDSGPDAGVPVATDSVWELRWEKTLFLQHGAPLVAALIPAGFLLLDRWEVAVPLWDYRKLAIEEGTDEDRARTAQVIRDLRVPMYDTRAIFVKRCEAGTALIEQWMAESPDRLGFLRAMYRVKPLVVALPVTWTGQWAPTTA
jgi:hypothetical protein